MHAAFWDWTTAARKRHGDLVLRCDSIPDVQVIPAYDGKRPERVDVRQRCFSEVPGEPAEQYEIAMLHDTALAFRRPDQAG